MTQVPARDPKNFPQTGKAYAAAADPLVPRRQSLVNEGHPAAHNPKVTNMIYDKPKTWGFSPYLTGSALLFVGLLAGPGSVLAQQGDVVLDPANTGQRTATPTISETFQQVAVGFDGLTEQIEGARIRFRDCFAAGVRDAREPIAPMQRKTCEIAYEGDLLRYHEQAEEVFNDAAVAFWAQVELLGNDVDALGAEEVEVRAELAEALSASALILEQVTALRAAEGAPDSPDEDLEYNRLRAAHQEAAIAAESFERKLRNLDRRAQKIEGLQLTLSSYGYDFAAIALDQGIYAADAEARINAMADDLVYQREGGDAGLPPGLQQLVTAIEQMRDKEGEQRTPLPEIAPTTGEIEVPTSQLGASTRGYDYFEDLMNEEVTQ